MPEPAETVEVELEDLAAPDPPRLGPVQGFVVPTLRRCGLRKSSAVWAVFKYPNPRRRIFSITAATDEFVVSAAEAASVETRACRTGTAGK